MKRLLIAAIVALPLASCKNTDVYSPEQGEETQKIEVNTFDYHTTSSVKTSISYTSFPSDVKGSVYFEVYDVYPFESEDNFADIKSDIKPVFTGYTNADGTFSESISLPSYMTKAYIYTANPLVTTLMVANVENGAFTATDEATTIAASRAYGVTRADGNYTTKAVTDDGWQMLLIGDDYDKTTGKLTDDFLKSNLTNSSLKLTDSNNTEILNIFNAYRENVDGDDVGNIPVSYGSETDLLITGGSKNASYAQFAITLVRSATWWTSTLGYYYYKDGEAPTSYEELKNRAIVIAPNTLSKNTTGSQNYNGMDENTTIQLKYFGEYNATTHKYADEKGSYNFPVGLRVGFVLYSNGWTNRAHQYSGGELKTRAATSIACCQYGKSADQSKPLTAVFRVGDYVIISFEDDELSERGRYSDCIFTIKSDPVDAFDVATVASTSIESTENIGVYAFEDMWPSVGDYDMNDVIIDAARTQTKTTELYTYYSGGTANSYIYSSETFNLTTYRNYATLDNEWAIRLKGVATELTSDQITVAKDGEQVQCGITREDNDYIVQMESIDESRNHEYSVSLLWAKPYANDGECNQAMNNKTEIQVFANRPSEGWEVHIPYEAPTTAMKSSSLFGTQDDKTDVLSGNWYTRAGEYPFAFFLAGATHNDISKLLDSGNEYVPIDQVYPKFASWVESNGTTDTDWYKTEE